jgi:uncharacterized radical SAM superfamily Fe-S cluster-containing enzyme
MCRSCRQIVPARILFRESEVWQERLCPVCGTAAALIAGDKDWYLSRLAEMPQDRSPLPASAHRTKERKGCPHDCGPCAWHATPCQLPVISVTNACNLRCPICFTYNRRDRIFYMPLAEIEEIVDWVVRANGQCDLLNITGGEPTLHPQILDIIKLCRRPEIGRVTMNSNGLLLANDFSLCEQLSELNVYVILSFDTFSPKSSINLHGQDLVETKLKAIENLKKAGVKMTLLNVLVREENEDVPEKLLTLMRQHDHILSLTIQTMTYTGQGGGSFARARHIPVDDAAKIVCRNLHGEIVPSDFVSRPSAHPLCYSLSYLFKLGDSFFPFTRVLSAAELREKLKHSYLLKIEDDNNFFSDVVNRLYAQNNTALLPKFKQLLGTLFPRDRVLSHFTRQQLAESSIRTVYIHTHMDEDTFDCSRVAMCPDQVPCAPGVLIPACTYNLFYRQQDERFYV